MTDSQFVFPLARASRVRDAVAWQAEAGQTEVFDTARIRMGPGNRLSESNFTPSFRAVYDDGHLHVLAAIKDDSISVSRDRITRARGDQVHILIAAETPSRAASRDPAEVLARISSASDRFVILAPSAGPAALAEIRTPDGEVTPIPGVHCRRTETGYLLFAGVPWSSLGMSAPRKGSSLVLNVVAFDADGVNLDHKIEWPWAGGEAFSYEDPAGWGELLFE